MKFREVPNDQHPSWDVSIYAVSLLVSAQVMFQRAIDIILQGVQGVIHDILVSGETVEQHLNQLHSASTRAFEGVWFQAKAEKVGVFQGVYGIFRTQKQC